MTLPPTPHWPAPTRRRRRWPILVAALAAAIALEAGVTVAVLHLRSSGDDKKQEQATCTTTPTAPPSTPTVPAAQAKLHVTEQGFSLTENGMLMVGAVIANEGDQAAYRTRITFRALRPDGTVLLAAGSEYTIYFRQEIPVILPGQRVAVGAIVNMGSSSEQPGRVEIELDTTRLVPADATNPLFRPVTAVLSQATSRSEVATGARFTVTDGGCPGLASRGVAMVFRDATGSIVGGSLDVGRLPGPCDGSRDIQIVHPQDVPTAADLSKTQLSVYCDAANASPDPDPSGSPVN